MYMIPTFDKCSITSFTPLRASLLALCISLCGGCSPQPEFSGKPLPAWKAQLNDSNPEYRREALVAIGAIASRGRNAISLLPTITSALKDSDKSVRMVAVEQIVSTALGATNILPTAIKALLSNTTFVSSEESIAISTVASKLSEPIRRISGKAAAEQIVRNVRDTLIMPHSATSKLLALDICRYIGAAELMPTIIQAINSKDEAVVHENAYRTIAELVGSAPRSLDATPLLAALDDSDPVTVRLTLIAVFHSTPPPIQSLRKIVGILKRNMRHNDQVASLAVRVLGAFGKDAAEALPSLIDALSSDSETLQSDVINAMVLLNSAALSAIPQLTAIVCEHNYNIQLRLNSAKAIAIIDPALEVVGTKLIREQLCKAVRELSSNSFTVTDLDHAALSVQISDVISEIFDKYPALVVHPPVTIDELRPWTVALAVKHPVANGRALQQLGRLQFRLGLNAPDGCTLDSATGVLKWTPTESQGPGVYRIPISIRTPQYNTNTDEAVISVSVREVNTAPFIADAPEMFVNYGDTLTLRCDIRDTDIPRNRLTVTIADDSPTGVLFQEMNHEITWKPTSAQTQQLWKVRLIIRDDGPIPMEVSKVFLVRVGGPKMVMIPDTVVDELTSLSVGVQLSPKQLAGEGIVFSLLGEPPIGCHIDQASGVVKWTPTEEQGPGDYNIRVGVKNQNAAEISDEKTMRVAVNEIKRPIRVVPTPPQIFESGGTLRVQINVLDEDSPRNPISFVLSGKSLNGATIDKKTGEFVWHPTTKASTWRLPVTINIIDENDAKALHESTFNATCLARHESIINNIDMRLHHLPHDDFIMGERHAVRISKSFLLGTTEVTRSQWTRVMGERKWPKGGEVMGDLPASGISWLEAIEFCNALSRLEGVIPFYPSKTGDGYRLPTEAEWEYACRSGSSDKWCCGDSVKELDEYAWYDSNSKHQLHAVGTKRSNRFGIYDMHGNVEEWCQAGLTGSMTASQVPDWVQTLLRIDPSLRSLSDIEKLAEFTDNELKPMINSPHVPDLQKSSVARGGSWLSVSDGTRSSAGLVYSSAVNHGFIGFRVCKTITYSCE